MRPYVRRPLPASARSAPVNLPTSTNQPGRVLSSDSFPVPGSNDLSLWWNWRVSSRPFSGRGTLVKLRNPTQITKLSNANTVAAQRVLGWDTIPGVIRAPSGNAGAPGKQNNRGPGLLRLEKRIGSNLASSLADSISASRCTFKAGAAWCPTSGGLVGWVYEGCQMT